MTGKFKTALPYNRYKKPLRQISHDNIKDILLSGPSGVSYGIRPEFTNQIGVDLTANPDFLNFIEQLIISILCQYGVIPDDYCTSLPTSFATSKHLKNINFLNLINENNTENEENSNNIEFSELSIENDEDVQLKINDDNKNSNNIKFSELSIENNSNKLNIDDSKNYLNFKFSELNIEDSDNVELKFDYYENLNNFEFSELCIEDGDNNAELIINENFNNDLSDLSIENEKAELQINNNAELIIDDNEKDNVLINYNNIKLLEPSNEDIKLKIDDSNNDNNIELSELDIKNKDDLKIDINEEL